jgi:hypothetical protein
VTLPIGEADVALASEAAYWLERFYAGTSAAISDGTVELTGDNLSGIMLERAWRAALHNERLYAVNSEKRRAALKGLTD